MWGSAKEDNMATPSDETVSQSPSSIDTRIRVGGAWLAIGSLAFVVGLVLHPPPSPNPSEFMATIAGAPTQWMAAHWLSAIAASLFVVVGLIILTAESRLTHNWWTTTAWAVLIVGALWIVTAALAEATVSTAAAVEGDTATFEMWQLFAEAHAAAFVAMAVPLALIAGNEARNGPETTPVWASWIGVAAGVVAAVAFVLVLGVGIAVAGILWLASAIVMSLWALWFGVSLARSDGLTSSSAATTEPTG